MGISMLTIKRRDERIERHSGSMAHYPEDLRILSGQGWPGAQQ